MPEDTKKHLEQIGKNSYGKEFLFLTKSYVEIPEPLRSNQQLTLYDLMNCEPLREAIDTQAPKEEGAKIIGFSITTIRPKTGHEIYRVGKDGSCLSVNYWAMNPEFESFLNQRAKGIGNNLRGILRICRECY